MKPFLTILAVLSLSTTAFASGGVPAIPQRSPHDEAVDWYNGGERRLEKLTKMHEEMKAAADPQQAEKLRQKITKGLEAAAADFQRAVRNDPNLYQAYSELGFALRKLGRYSESLDAYNKALAIQPGYSPAIEYRAEAFLGLDQLDEVKNAYMLLFSGDRPRADILMVSMKSWIAERRGNAGTLDAQKLDDFAKWVGQRETIAGQTSALSATTASFRSW